MLQQKNGDMQWDISYFPEQKIPNYWKWTLDKTTQQTYKQLLSIQAILVYCHLL